MQNHSLKEAGVGLAKKSGWDRQAFLNLVLQAMKWAGKEQRRAAGGVKIEGVLLTLQGLLVVPEDHGRGCGAKMRKPERYASLGGVCPCPHVEESKLRQLVREKTL